MPDTPDIPVVAFTGFLADTNAPGVRIEPGDDARALIPFLGQLAVIEIAFPGFRDGRGYSSARILREAGFGGTLRAVGDVLADQIVPMTRCGFDDFAPNVPLDPDVVAASLARFPAWYQRASDQALPVWKQRHG